MPSRPFAALCFAIFILLTRPDKAPVWVNIDQIILVMPSITSPGHTTVRTQAGDTEVAESVDRVMRAIHPSTD
jgi:hypothetical protein